MFTDAKIIFAGLSTATTPKIALIKDAIEQLGIETETVAIVKYPEQKQRHINFVINQRSTTLKVLLAAAQALRAMAYLIKQTNKQSICYAINPPSGLMALILKIIKGTPYLYETHEIFCGFNNDIYGGWRRHLWHRVESLIIKKSEYFIATDEFRLKFLKRYYKIKTTPSFFLYNTTNNHFVEKEQTTPKIKGSVSYCGGIYPDRMIDTVIAAFSKCTIATQLTLAGTYDQHYKDELNKLIESLKIQDRVIFTGPLPNTELKSIMAQSEVTIAIYSQDCTNNRLCSPNKFFDAIATNTQIITTQSPLAKRLLVANNLGEVCNPLTEINLTQNIYRALNRDTDSEPNGKHGKNSQFLWDAESAKLKTAITTLST